MATASSISPLASASLADATSTVTCNRKLSYRGNETSSADDRTSSEVPLNSEVASAMIFPASVSRPSAVCTLWQLDKIKYKHK
jgi:hypothetical protein